MNYIGVVTNRRTTSEDSTNGAPQRIASGGHRHRYGSAGVNRAHALPASMLFEIEATDPVTLAGVALILVGVAAIASFVPAHRATLVDPFEARRSELGEKKWPVASC